MSDDFRPRLTVDLSALRRNARALAAMRPGSALMPVVKADSYGLGAEKVVAALSEEGIGAFFVAYAEEAISLESLAPDAVFYIFNAAPGTGPYTDKRRPIFYRREDLEAWNGGPCAVQIELGMHRMGVLTQALRGLPPRDDVAMVVAHMSDSGTPSSPRNDLQRQAFTDAVSMLRSIFPKADFSLSATGSLMLDGLVEEAAIRPGIGLYGGAPGPQGALETVATFAARVMSVHEIPAGESVGYDGRWTAARPSRIATIGAGYADGVLRSLTNKGKVWLAGAQHPMVGTISMDLTTIDVTDAGEIAIGDWAEIFGPHVALDDVAAHVPTIGYELLTAVRGRTARHYTDDSAR